MKSILKSIPLGILCFLVSFPGTAAAQNSTVSVRLVDTLSTGSSQPGDTFSATLASPLIWQNHVVAEPGAYVTGRVIEVVSRGWPKRPALITLSLENAQERSDAFPVQTGDLTIQADAQSKRNLIIIGGAAAAGAVIGGASGGGRGAAIGAATGAGAGTLGAYVAGNREIVIPSETLLTFHVSSVRISPRELDRLQSSRADRNDRRYGRRESYPVLRHRRHHGDDDDDDDDGYEGRYSRGRYSRADIYRPDYRDYGYLRGYDDDDYGLDPVSVGIGIAAALTRPWYRYGGDDD